MAAKPRTSRSKRTTGAKERKPPKPKTAAKILSYRDDPMNADLVEGDIPDLGLAPFTLSVQGNQPPPGIYQTETEEFRYWNLIASLGRGAQLWRSVVEPGTRWFDGAVLSVFLNRGTDLNAYYDRQSLSFFQATVGGQIIYSGESPDIICHELGHAVLDALRPELFDAMSIEAAAFHEAFGDISALLSALQTPAFRLSVLDETENKLQRSSRLSRIGEQLGWAIRQRHLDATDPDCLRNAANSHFYMQPEMLPPSGPATILTSQPHSFSRVFTGAFLEAFAGMLLAHAAEPSDADLEHVTSDAAQLLVDTVLAAPVVTDYFTQIAMSFIAADQWRFKGKYRDALKSAFVRRGILSLQSAASVVPMQAALPTVPARAAAAHALPAYPSREGKLPDLQLDGNLFGLGSLVLRVASAGQPRVFAAAAAAPEVGGSNPANEQRAARAFAEDLFKRGRVDLHDFGEENRRIVHPHTRKTHELKRVDSDGYIINRRFFDCGLDPI